MSVEQNIALAQRVVEEVWHQGKLDVIESLFATDYVDHTLGPKPAGRDEMAAFVASFRAAFPDLKYTQHQLIAEDDTVASRDSVQATHQGDFMGIPATGKSVTIDAMHFVRFKDGKVVERWGINDIMGLMQQLGLGGGPGGH